MRKTDIDELQNEFGAAVLEVPCPYKNCPAGYGAKCRTKARFDNNGNIAKGGNIRDSVHHSRYKKAKEKGEI